MTTEEITTLLRGKERMGYTASTYTMFDENTLVRVSNHLPKEVNFWKNEQQNVERVFFIFAESNLNQRQVEKYLEEEFSNYNYDFMIVEEGESYDLDIITHFINNF